MVKSRTKAAFRLSGFSCSPKAITKALGLCPTRSWILGDVITGTTLKRQSSGWELATRLSEDRDISDHVNDIIEQLDPILEKLNGLQYGGSSLISCVLYIFGDERPPIYISSSLMRKIYEIEADFDVDLYNIS